MGYTLPPSLFGFIVSGDVAGFTVYTDRFGHKVWFPKAPPTKPPTDMQVAQRARFRSAQQEYMGLSPLIKQTWERLVQIASLAMTGQNLFIAIAFRPTNRELDTLTRQTSVAVSPPTKV